MSSWTKEIQGFINVLVQVEKAGIPSYQRRQMLNMRKRLADYLTYRGTVESDKNKYIKELQCKNQELAQQLSAAKADGVRHSMNHAYMKTDTNILIDAINQIRVDGDWGSTYVVDFGDIDIVTHYHEDGTSSVKAFDSLESLYSHVKLEYECTLQAISE